MKFMHYINNRMDINIHNKISKLGLITIEVDTKIKQREEKRERG